MKKIISLTLVIAIIVLSLCLVSCNSETSKSNNEAKTSTDTNSTGAEDLGIWSKATYTTDTEIGSGSIEFKFEVKAESKVVTFTVHTEKENLCEALLENELIAGDEGSYGLYIKTVNGMLADYDTDQSYWMLNVNGAMSMESASSITIKSGDVYQFEYAK